MDKIVDSQFYKNIELIKDKLKDTRGLLTLLLGLLDSGKLEEAYHRQMGATPNAIATFALSAKYLKQAGVVWIRNFLATTCPRSFGIGNATSEE